MTACSQQFNNRVFSDLQKQGFAKQGADLTQLPDDWLWAFYQDSLQWMREERSQSAIAAHKQYRQELQRRTKL